MKYLFSLLALSVFCSICAFPQDSRQKENVLAARKTEQEKQKNRDFCAKLTSQQSLSDNRCFEIYPSDVVDWGKGFSNGLAKITVDGKTGFINTKGEIVVQPKLKDAGRFSENLAPFESDNGKWGFIDTKGQVVIKPQFDWAISFHEGLALIQVGELWGYIDRDGKIVVEPKFQEAASFSEGLARIGFYDKDYVWTLLKGMTNGKWRFGFIDKQGKWAIEPVFDQAYKDFNGGMALVSRNVGYDNGVTSEAFFIDRQGRELWVLDSWYITQFSDDTMVVAVGKNDEGNDAFGFIDRHGKQMTGKSFANISGFSEGLSAAKVSFNGKYGYINKNGDFLIKPKFDFAMSFSEGLAGAEDRGEGYGFIDKSGKWVVKPQFNWVWNFQEGFALVAPKSGRNSEEKTGYIDRSGKYIWKPTK